MLHEFCAILLPRLVLEETVSCTSLSATCLYLPVSVFVPITVYIITTHWSIYVTTNSTNKTKLFMLLWSIDYSAWTRCSTAVQSEGCTFYDLFTQVLQYSRWSQFYVFDVNQQRYREAVESVQHLCTNIEPGINTLKAIISQVKTTQPTQH